MIEFDISKNVAKIGGQMIVFHCNHYNLTLQRTIIEAIGEKGVEIQINAAKQSTEQMLSNIDGDKRSFAIDNFSKLGFGILNCDKLDENGGTANTPVSHYALAWYEKFGSNDKPVCYFNAGYILGVFNSVHNKQLSAKNIKETECRVTDPENINTCLFEVTI